MNAPYLRQDGSVRVVLDLLLDAVGLDVDGERLLDAELVVDERDLVLARGQLDELVRRVHAGVRAVDEDVARRLAAEQQRALRPSRPRRRRASASCPAVGRRVGLVGVVSGFVRRCRASRRRIRRASSECVTGVVVGRAGSVARRRSTSGVVSAGVGVASGRAGPAFSRLTTIFSSVDPPNMIGLLTET